MRSRDFVCNGGKGTISFSVIFEPAVTCCRYRVAFAFPFFHKTCTPCQFFDFCRLPQIGFIIRFGNLSQNKKICFRNASRINLLQLANQALFYVFAVGRTAFKTEKLLEHFLGFRTA